MNKHKLGLAVALTAGLAAIGPVGAVTVDIDVRTEGEPVPGTTITFETADGKEIPPVQLTELTEEEKPKQEPPAEQTATDTPATEEAPPKTKTPPATAENETEPKSEDDPQVAEDPHTPFRVELPDDFIGQDIVVVVRKGDELIKKEDTKLDPENPKVQIEAYDPADAKLAIEATQPEICRRGRNCKQQLSITNNGNGIYTGPVFLTGTMHGLPDNSSKQEDAWFCGYVGHGKQLCQNTVSLQPGETETWAVNVRLNRRISQRASSCVSVTRLDGEPAGRSDPLLQAVQLGLAERGINPGRPDGIMGPKTNAAIGQFLEQQGAPGNATLQQVFQSIYGMSPERLARLGVAELENCTRLSLVKEKRKVTKKKRKKRRRARREYVEEEIYEDEIYEEPRVRVQIGIGFGGTVNRGHRRHRPRARSHRRTREHRIERRQPRRHRRIERRWQD